MTVKILTNATLNRLWTFVEHDRFHSAFGSDTRSLCHRSIRVQYERGSDIHAGVKGASVVGVHALLSLTPFLITKPHTHYISLPPRLVIATIATITPVVYTGPVTSRGPIHSPRTTFSSRQNWSVSVGAHKIHVEPMGKAPDITRLESTQRHPGTIRCGYHNTHPKSALDDPDVSFPNTR